MATCSPSQERQLVLMESINRRLDSFLESQKKLEEKNATLQQENVKLRTELSKQERLNNTKRGSKRKRTESKVEVPMDLRNRFRFIYKKMVDKKMTSGFKVEEDPQSEVNQDILSKIKEVLKKEHGGENCPWTDLQMEAQFLCYFRTVKEKCQRIRKGKNEEHKQRCKMSRHLTSKLDRRCGAFELIRESLSSSQKQLAPEVLYVEYMSSEESAYEDEEDPITGEVTQKLKGYLTKKLSWERTALTNLKSKLDRAHYRSLTPHAKALAKPRFESDISKRQAPDGPSWAVRRAIAQ